jgi:hypothetical protein
MISTRNGAGFGPAVHFTQRDAGGLIFGDYEDLVAIGNLSNTFDHDTVPCPVAIPLQTEAGTRLDVDALDRKAASVVNTVAQAPCLVTGQREELFRKACTG